MRGCVGVILSSNVSKSYLIFYNNFERCSSFELQTTYLLDELVRQVDAGERIEGAVAWPAVHAGESVEGRGNLVCKLRFTSSSLFFQNIIRV